MAWILLPVPRVGTSPNPVSQRILHSGHQGWFREGHVTPTGHTETTGEETLPVVGLLRTQDVSLELLHLVCYHVGSELLRMEPAPWWVSHSHRSPQGFDGPWEATAWSYDLLLYVIVSVCPQVLCH